ncbi:MAG: hypothetical protein AB1586_03880 [Pseudomonadota bacterium]|jgi:hypothetical protein
MSDLIRTTALVTDAAEQRRVDHSFCAAGIMAQRPAAQVSAA